MAKPNGSANENVTIDVSLTGDYNKLSFTLSLKHFREIIILASYIGLGLVPLLILMFFKVCRREFFSEDII